MTTPWGLSTKKGQMVLVSVEFLGKGVMSKNRLYLFIYLIQKENPLLYTKFKSSQSCSRISSPSLMFGPESRDCSHGEGFE